LGYKLEAEKSKIYSKLDRINNLPVIPEIMFDAIATIKSDPGNVIKLSEILGKDQAMVAKILSVANSPLYGMLRKVSSLEFAIMIMGSNELQNVITALSLSNAIKLKSTPNFDQKQYWKHSMAVGLIAKDIARNQGFPDLSGEAFVSGMLHDLGVQLLVKYFPDEFEQISEKESGYGSFYEAEIDILEMTHQDIGAYLLNKWELPDPLIQSVENHHSPAYVAENIELVSIVHLADFIANHTGAATGSWDKGIKLSYSICENLGFKDRGKLDEFVSGYSEVVSETVGQLKI
jgi:putative nucleotidyltransferase with HDIG domain